VSSIAEERLIINFLMDEDFASDKVTETAVVLRKKD
jgi:hypothetical protein